jgi:hypothetical protein
MKRLIILGLVLLSSGCGTREPEKQHQAELLEQQRFADEIRTEKLAEEARRKTEEELARKVAEREEKTREDNARRLRRHCMSGDEIDAFLWVRVSLFKRLIQEGEAVKFARARAEIASSKAFGLEPLNWAKRDIVEFVENEKLWKKQRDDVEQRLKAAKDYSEQVLEQQGREARSTDPQWFPGKNALKDADLYWSESARKANPTNPYSIAIENERAIEHEREQLYHRFNKDTVEER